MARQVADWAVGNTANCARLARSLERGVEGLFDLCAEVAIMSLPDLGDLHRIKRTLMDPVARKLSLEYDPDEETGAYVWYNWSGEGRPRLSLPAPNEVINHPQQAILLHWIYCELFHNSIRATVDQSQPWSATLPAEIRLLYLSYCLPDAVNNIIEAPLSIFMQARRYFKTPGPKSDVDYFMLIQGQLYETSLFSTSGIHRALVCGTASEHETSEEDMFSLFDDSLKDMFLYNMILHRPLLCMRLHLPDGVEATKEEITELRRIADDAEKSGLKKAWMQRETMNEDDVLGEDDVLQHALAKLAKWSSVSSDIEIVLLGP